MVAAGVLGILILGFATLFQIMQSEMARLRFTQAAQSETNLLKTVLETPGVCTHNFTTNSRNRPRQIQFPIPESDPISLQNIRFPLGNTEFIKTESETETGSTSFSYIKSIQLNRYTKNGSDLSNVTATTKLGSLILVFGDRNSKTNDIVREVLLGFRLDAAGNITSCGPSSDVTNQRPSLISQFRLGSGKDIPIPPGIEDWPDSIVCQSSGGAAAFDQILPLSLANETQVFYMTQDGLYYSFDAASGDFQSHSRTAGNCGVAAGGSIQDLCNSDRCME